MGLSPGPPLQALVSMPHPHSWALSLGSTCPAAAWPPPQPGSTRQRRAKAWGSALMLPPLQSARPAVWRFWAPYPCAEGSANHMRGGPCPSAGTH